MAFVHLDMIRMQLLLFTLSNCLDIRLQFIYFLICNNILSIDCYDSVDACIVLGLNVSLEPTEFDRELESLNGIGSLSVERTGDCANFDLSVTFLTLPGDLPEMTVII